MIITLQKKLSKSQKKEFIYKNKTYDWDINYEKLIRDFVEADFSYDKDNRKNLIDNEPINDIVFYDILTMFEKSGLGINNQNNIKKAITNLCKENEFSIKANEKLKKSEENQKQLENLPNIVFDFINDKWGKLLSYNITNKTVYYNDKKITEDDINVIVMELNKIKIVKSNLTRKEMFTIIKNVAELKKFKEEIEINDDQDDEFDILRNVNSDNWQNFIETDKKGNMVHSIFNYALYLCYHPQFKDKIKLDMFSKIEFITKYDKQYKGVVNLPIDDDQYNLLKAKISEFFGDYTNKYLEAALSVVLQKNSFHELKEKLYKIKQNGWDGKKRMHKMLVKYFGCEDREEIWNMTEVMMCGAVQRLLEEKPDSGTMFDYIGVMFGLQGTGKTKFMTRLHFGDKYCVLNPDVEDNQIFTDLSNRAWLVLFDEMKAINKADMTTVKSRITEQGVQVRLSYGRRSKYYPRHNIFWGNTNYTGLYRDEGYERRFLTFECKGEKHTAEWWNNNYTDYDIEQIWAETICIYEEKYKHKVIEIDSKTEEYNYRLQQMHKIWIEDSKTDVELKEIFNNKKYSRPYYLQGDFRMWMKDVDAVRLGTTNETGNHINIIPLSWIIYRLPRKRDWIIGMMNNITLDDKWKLIYLENDKLFGTGEFYIRENMPIDEIYKDYNSYSSAGFDIRNDENDVPF